MDGLRMVARGPNPIAQKDLDGWVREGGLDLPEGWHARLQPLWRCHDMGEPPQHGGMVRI